MTSIPDILSNFSCHSPEESIIKVSYFLFLSYLLKDFMEFVTASIVAIFDKKGDHLNYFFFHILSIGSKKKVSYRINFFRICFDK